MVSNRLIVVLGMHRSGTSAITKSLELLGVGLGSDLHPAGIDNPKGFWEDRECLDINEQMLRHLGSAYDRLGLAWEEIQSDSKVSELKLKAIQLISRKLSENNGIWGFKDPRTCRLLGFWKEVFLALECDVSFVIAVRNPASVVASLASRNSTPVEKAYFLWLQHVLPTLNFMKESRKIVVDYDELMANPYSQIARISSRLGLPLPARKSALVSEYEKNFLESRLRHTLYTETELALDKRASSIVTMAYKLLHDLAIDQESLDSQSVEDAINELNMRLKTVEPAFNLINSLEDERVSIYRAVAELQDQIVQLNQLIAQYIDQISHFNQSMTERDGQTAHLNQAVAERERQIDSLNQEIAEHTRQICNFTQAIAKRDNQTSHLNQTAAERDCQISHPNQSVAERERQIDNLDQGIAEHARQISNFTQAIAARDNQIIHLKQTVADCNQQIYCSNQAVRDERRKLAQVLASKSWRLTKPLRFTRRVVVDKPYALVRRTVSNASRDVWHALPLSFDAKQKYKGFVFNHFPSLLRRTKAYQAWKNFISPASDPGVVSPVFKSQTTQSHGEYVQLLIDKPLNVKPAKLICFYLPQFHPIPENNAWWGDGFTEWTNVAPAQPQFAGHYQPHVPGDLGYYNLLDSTVQQRQVELAKLYGVEGFCFYFYWFAGKRLLEAPIENYLSNSNLDLPFCLCWANENWSRRWDGLDSEILMAQQHSVEDDLAFIQHVARYMRDPRYISISGKPLLLVYRPSLLPSAKETAARWRKWCRENGLGEIYLAYTQSFEAVDPANYGFDAAIEFPPNNSAPPNITDRVSPNGDDFGCTVYDWQVFVERSENYKRLNYKVFRSVCPSWDNTARRKNRSTVFLNSTPALYQRWLENAIQETAENFNNSDERLIFVNAWNEWAEGAHLEPDARYGYAWLQATRNALSAKNKIQVKTRKIILVAHDAYPHGAQLLAVNLAKTLNQGMGFDVDLVCLGDGPLKAEYAKWSTLHDLTGVDARGATAISLVKELYESGNRMALVNTTVSGYFLETLAIHGIECVALIHELRGVLDQLNLRDQATVIAKYAKKIVFPAKEVACSFGEVAQIPDDKIVIRPQGLYKRREKSLDRKQERMHLRQKLGLPDESQVILGVGYADYRKGIDLFVEAGLTLAERAPLARWVWIGHWDHNMQHAIEKRLAQFPNFKDRFVFPGLQSDTNIFYGGADIFALSSREDPFPSVVLEALDAGLPVIGFEGAGGFTNLLNEGCGKLVAKGDTIAFANAVGDMIDAPDIREVLGRRGLAIINERFSFRHYLFDLLDLLGMNIPRVSVIVPNYNYAQYLPERFSSIIKQTYPIFEIIFLDDKSKDESVSVATGLLETAGIDYKIVLNEENSGSVFMQWKKGVDLAMGTHVWIAEADDSCCADFINEVITGFLYTGVVLSYSESQQMAEDGKILSKNYLEYVADVDQSQWCASYIKNGIEEIQQSLSIKNTIPNVSAVIFKKEVIHSVLDENLQLICSYRIAGDWLVYTLILERGNIAFFSESLNLHRRHSHSMTIGNFNILQLDEIRRMQEYIAGRHAVPAEKEVASRKYIETLTLQFGFSVN